MTGTTPLSAPEPRLIRTPEDAEMVVRDWLRYWGQIDAIRVGGSGDMGVDVESEEFVVQVKAMMANVGRPVVQQTYGVAGHRGKKALVFSLGGYTEEAMLWAADAGVGLFEFDFQGVPQPANVKAARLSASRSSPDGDPSRLLVSTGQEIVDWLKRHWSRVESNRSNVLVVADNRFAKEAVLAVTEAYPRSVVIEADPAITVTVGDVMAAMSHVEADGLVVVDGLGDLPLEIVGMIGQAVTAATIEVDLGQFGPLTFELPQFLLVGVTANPGRLPSQLTEIFDYWLIQT